MYAQYITYKPVYMIFYEDVYTEEINGNCYMTLSKNPNEMLKEN
jgi:hypothetical protein